MPRPKSSAHLDKTDEELTLGRGTRNAPVFHRCTFPGCFFGSSNIGIHNEHQGVKHVACDIEGCEGQYSLSQRDCHKKRAHDIDPPRSTGPYACRHSGCQWSSDSRSKQEKHEDEAHITCQFKGCDFRGSRAEYLAHVRMSHDETMEEQWHLSQT